MASEGGDLATETGKVFSEPCVKTDGCPSVDRVKTSTSDFDEWAVADLAASMPVSSDQITADEPSTDNVGVLSTSESPRARGVQGGLNAAAVGAAEIGGGGGGLDIAGKPKAEDAHHQSSVSDVPSGKNNVDASRVSAPATRPVRVPKKSLFGKFLKKKPSKANVEVPDTSGALPRESRDNYGPTAGGGLDVAVAVPSADVDASAPLASSAGGLDVPSVGAEISGDVPSVDAKLTGQGVHVVGGGISLGAGLAAGATTAVSATAIGHGVSGTAKKQEGELPRVPGAHLSVPDMPRSGTKVGASVSAPVKQPVGSMAPRKSLFGKCLVKKPTNANVEVTHVRIEATDKPSGSVGSSGPSAPGGMPSVGVDTRKKSLFGKFLKKAPRSKP